MRQRLIQYKTLNDLTNRLKDKLRKDGNKQFKDGVNYLKRLKYLQKLFENVDEINNLLLLKNYLNKWNDKANKLKKRENKLKKGLDEIEKRQLINDIDTIANAELTKQLLDSIPVARAYDFFDKLKDLDRKRRDMSNYKNNLIRRRIIITTKYYDDLLKNKLKHWLETANKIRDNAAKTKIRKRKRERKRKKRNRKRRRRGRRRR